MTLTLAQEPSKQHISAKAVWMENKQTLTMSVYEASVLLGIGRNLAYRLAREGSLPGVRKLGTRYIVSRTELNNFLTEVPDTNY